MGKGKTMDLTIRILGNMDRSLTSSIGQAQSKVGSLASNISNIGTTGLRIMEGLAVGIGAMATVAVKELDKCVDAASSFEDHMARVVKYVDGLADKNGKITVQTAENGKTYRENYTETRQNIMQIATEVPLTKAQITEITAAAGQSGYQMDQLFTVNKETGKLEGFVKDMAVAAAAWDLDPETLGKYGAKWENIMNMDHAGIMEVFDMINYTAANSPTTAAELASVVNSIAALGDIAGVSVPTVTALADAFMATGLETSVAATSARRMFLNLTEGESASKKDQAIWQKLGFGNAQNVSKMMQEDSTGTIQKLVEAMNALPKDEQLSALNTLFGARGIQGIAAIANNPNAFQRALALVGDKENYTGSMQREFEIMSGTDASKQIMAANAKDNLAVTVGDPLLEAKKQWADYKIDFYTRLAEMPGLTEASEQVAGIFGQGLGFAGDLIEKAMPYLERMLNYFVEKGPEIQEKLSALFENGLERFGDALDKALPKIESALDYMIDHGPEIVSTIKTVLGVLIGMKFAPQISSVLNGAGNLILGNRSGAFGRRRGGLTGAISSLWNRGQNAGTQIMGQPSTTGPLQYLGNIGSGIGNVLGANGLNLPGAFQAIANTAPAQAIGGAIGNAGASIGSFLGNAAGTIGGLVGSAGASIGGMLGNVGAGIGQFIAGSPAAQTVLRVGSNTLTTGAGLLGNIWGPIAGGFGNLLSGALPIVGVISTIIAVVSILGDHLEDIRGIIQNVFGDAGVEVFDKFVGVLQNVGDFITGLFQDGGVAEALAPLRDMITNIFGDEAGATFDSFVGIIQSVMGVVGQVIDFAENNVKPIIEKIFDLIVHTVMPAVLNIFNQSAPAISGIISGIGSAVMSVATIITDAIEFVWPVIDWLVQYLSNCFQVWVPAIMAGISVLADGIKNVVNDIKRWFEGVIEFITGVFTGDWDKAWNGVKDIFGGIFDLLGDLIKTPINVVITLINKAISGINDLGLTIPDWVPVLGGKDFKINIPEIPMLAKGGFTTGPSIAGEAGTEAVISFQKGVRSENIATWWKAGQMLGALDSGRTLPELPGGQAGGASYEIVFAPQITANGGSRSEIDSALMESEERFQAWLEANFERLCQRREREMVRRAYG